MTDVRPIASSPANGAHKTAVPDEAKKAKLKKAAQEFESVFVGYLLKTMRSTVPKSDMFGDSFGGDILDGMFDIEMARSISHGRGLGIGEMIFKRMAGETGTTDSEKPQLNPLDLRALRPPPLVKESTGTAPPDTVSRRVARFTEMIQEAADYHSLDPNLLKAVIAAESGGKPAALSKKDAKGLMQLMDSTASDLGVSDVWNPRENVFGGAKYLKQLLDQFAGDVQLALASYNAGPGAVERYKGIPPYRETQDYVNRVMDYLKSFTTEADDE